MVVCLVGALTAIVAATIGMTQFDIKRVIAYSTMSQLGYMFFALGVSAYSAAMFHLVTHAFFKALLFLGAGSVIHAMSGEQDMRKMGGNLEENSCDLCLDVDRLSGFGGVPFLCWFLFQRSYSGGRMGFWVGGGAFCLLGWDCGGFADGLL
jgi:NADH:ubiquinone oxidoreductase subunit 5 (subunit L)/multisubunit Na+/H+ antiporter MnhA subunit